MKDGSKELYTFISKNIKETYDLRDREDFYSNEENFPNYLIGGPFSWNKERDIITSSGLHSYEYCINEDVEKFSEIISDEDMQTINTKIESIRVKFEESIKKEMEETGLTLEETEFLRDILHHADRNELNRDTVVRMIKEYGIDLNRSIYRIASIEFDDSKESLEEYMYNNSVSYDKYQIIEEVKLSDEIFDDIIANGDVLGFVALSKNKYLTTTQALKLKDTVKNMNDYRVDSVMQNLFDGNLFDENDIRDMYNGDKDEKKHLLYRCKTLPEDIIQDELNSDDTYKKSDKNGIYVGRNSSQLLAILRNNKSLSEGLISQFKEYSNTVARQEGSESDFLAALMAQENIPLDMMIQIAKNPRSTGVCHEFFKREDKPYEVIEIWANANSPFREEVAKQIVEGKITVGEEIFRELALDRAIDEKIRKKLLSMPEYKERLPEIDESSLIDVEYKDVRFGGWGPGSFDNRGGERRFFVNDINILSQSGHTVCEPDEAGKTWARDAYTSFDFCSDLEDVKKYCQEHKNAILVILENKELYKSFGELSDRVNYIEEELDKRVQNNEAVHEITEVETAISDSKAQDINTVLEEMTKDDKEIKKENYTQDDDENR